MSRQPAEFEIARQPQPHLPATAADRINPAGKRLTPVDVSVAVSAAAGPGDAAAKTLISALPSPSVNCLTANSDGPDNTLAGGGSSNSAEPIIPVETGKKGQHKLHVEPHANPATKLKSPSTADPVKLSPTTPAPDGEPSSESPADAAPQSRKGSVGTRRRRDGLRLDNPFGELVSELPQTQARYATRRRTAEAVAIATGGTATPPEGRSTPTTPVLASLTPIVQQPKRRKRKCAVLDEAEGLTDGGPAAVESAVRVKREEGADQPSTVGEASESKEPKIATASIQSVGRIVIPDKPVAATPTVAAEKAVINSIPSPTAAKKIDEALSSTAHSVEGAEEPIEKTSQKNLPRSAHLVDNSASSPAGKEATPEPKETTAKSSPPTKRAVPGTPTSASGSAAENIPAIARAARKRRGADRDLALGLDSSTTALAPAASAAPRRPVRTVAVRSTRKGDPDAVEHVLAAAFSRTAPKPYSITKMACPIPELVVGGGDAGGLPSPEERCRRRFDVPAWMFVPRPRLAPTGKTRAVPPPTGIIDPEFSTLRTNVSLAPADVRVKYTEQGRLPTPPPFEPVRAGRPVSGRESLAGSTDTLPMTNPTPANRPRDPSSAPALEPQPARPSTKRLRWRWLDPNPPLAPPHPDLHRFAHPYDETHTAHTHHLPVEATLLPAPAWLPRELDALARGLAAVGKSFTIISREYVKTRATGDCVEAYYMRKHEIARVVGWMRARRRGPVAMAVGRTGATGVAEDAERGVGGGGGGVETRRTKMLKTTHPAGVMGGGQGMAEKRGEGVAPLATRVEPRGVGGGRGRRGRAGKLLLLLPDVSHVSHAASTSNYATSVAAAAPYGGRT
ncbi:hypothetical protein DFJ73DRAFT_906758 [Zopfochytrium polystomum]|nr:hypothetical protein DFJ73DRAFT_906758 [Zopfochytrium polystomum]